MKQIHISETTYDHLLALAAERGIHGTELDRLADETLRQAVGLPLELTYSGEELVRHFREFRGALRDTSLAQIVSDRHRGLD